MAGRLVGYIQQQVNAGYQPEAIRDYLVKYGYDEKEVDDSLRSIYGKPIVVESHFSGKVLIAVVLGLLLVIGIPTTYLLLQGGGSTPAVVSIQTSSSVTSLEAGDTLTFSVSLQNTGDSTTVSLRHEIIGTSAASEETVSLGASVSRQSSISLPSTLNAQRYTLQTIAAYDGKQTVSSFGFNIIAPEEEAPDCTENWSCNDWNPLTCPSSGEQTRLCQDLNQCGTTQFKPEETKFCTFVPDVVIPPPAPSGPYDGLNIFEKLERAKQLASTDIAEAERLCKSLAVQTHVDDCYLSLAEIQLSIGYCTSIQGERTKDKCYNNVAKFKDDNSLCERIVKLSRKDSCYMNFVNKGDYSVCAKIDNSYLAEACISLRDLPEVIVT